MQIVARSLSNQDKQWSGTDTIRSHILPSTPNGKQLNTYIDSGKPNEQFFPRQVVIQLPKIY